MLRGKQRGTWTGCFTGRTMPLDQECRSPSHLKGEGAHLNLVRLLLRLLAAAPLAQHILRLRQAWQGCQDSAWSLPQLLPALAPQGHSATADFPAYPSTQLAQQLPLHASRLLTSTELPSLWYCRSCFW